MVPGRDLLDRSEDGLGADLIPIVVVDDQALFRGAMVDVVTATSEFAVVGEAASGEEALRAVAELSPRMVIIDNRMPGMSGVETTRVLTERHEGLVVLLVSIDAFDPQVRACGAAAFACKHELSPRLLREVWRSHGS
jgi:two-component system invasion response regulator UvrY